MDGENSENSTLENFIEQLIEEKNFPNLSPEVYSQLKKDLLEKLQATINAQAISTLSEADANSLSKMLDQNASTEDTQKFMETHVPDASSVLTNTLLEFRKSYLGLT